MKLSPWNDSNIRIQPIRYSLPNINNFPKYPRVSWIPNHPGPMSERGTVIKQSDLNPSTFFISDGVITSLSLTVNSPLA